MQQTAGYFSSPQIGGASPRETEILAFGLCNDRLAKAHTSPDRIDALHKTHQLWSLLVRDLASTDNALPVDLKRQIATLGLWAMHYSTQARFSDLPLTPLIDVHNNMIDGLKNQKASI